MIIIDFETKSRCDLLAAATYNYISDPSTDILCMAMFDMESDYKEVWCPAKGPLSEMMRYKLEHASYIGAHYAEFDQGIYEYIGVEDYDFPEIPREKWYCTSAQMRVNAIPAGLDHAAWALGLTTRKFSSGANLIKQLSIPQADGTFNQDPVLHDQMREYCMQDVIVTAGCVAATRPMSQQEHADWLKTCEVNERGIKCDLELATLSLKYADIEIGEIGAELAKLTGGLVDRPTQSARIKNWIKSRLGELHPVMQEMTVYKKGKATFSLDKNIRRTILEKADMAAIDLPDDVFDVIMCLDEGSMSSVSKFKRMLQQAGEDDRVRGAFVFAGASQTLRYASRGLQLHNMKRDCWTATDIEAIKETMRRGGDIGGELTVMETLSRAMRPALIPEAGNVFVVGDWSSIEARALHYLSDTISGDIKLDLFESGADVYMKAAQDMGFDDRQIGKVAELSCGYQGAKRALQAMARNYGVKLSDSQADDIVRKWRDANWWIVEFWRKLETAAKQAITHPGERFKAGLVEYAYVPHLINGTLFCMMPGGHVIQYPKAKIEQVMTPWGDVVNSVTSLKAAFKPKADAKQWPRTTLYGGLFCENICQAFSAALLRNALRKTPDVVAHVHDEIVMEVPVEVAEEAVGVLRSIMLDVPDWANGLPLDADPKIMTRYGK